MKCLNGWTITLSVALVGVALKVAFNQSGGPLSHGEVYLPGFYQRTTQDHYVVDYGWFFKATTSECLVAFFVEFLFSGSFTATMRAEAAVSQKVVRMHDARKLEQEEGLSKEAFFDKFGFVLLDHQSQMSASDWIESSYKAGDPTSTIESLVKELWESDTPTKRVYAREVEELVRTLYPQVTDVFAPTQGLRRGPGGTNVLGATVHTDFSLTFDEIVKYNPSANFGMQREKFEQGNATAYMFVNFWRPVLPMQKPIAQNPLCFCDPSTVKPEDLVDIDMYGQVPGGQRFLGLKHTPEQTWYHYPHMNLDEVVLFKQFHYVKGEERGRMPVLHTAFEDPTVPTEHGIEPRCSFEYRVGFLLDEPVESS